MNRLKSGVTQCIAWLRANIGSKKYAALVETRSGAIKSSGWLAAEAAKRLGAPTSLVVVDTVSYCHLVVLPSVPPCERGARSSPPLCLPALSTVPGVPPPPWPEAAGWS
jgi:hypothetical protein